MCERYTGIHSSVAREYHIEIANNNVPDCPPMGVDPALHQLTLTTPEARPSPQENATPQVKRPKEVGVDDSNGADDDDDDDDSSTHRLTPPLL